MVYLVRLPSPSLALRLVPSSPSSPSSPPPHSLSAAEGSRSRTGKPIHPKGGLLSVLVDSVMEGGWGRVELEVGQGGAGGGAGSCDAR